MRSTETSSAGAALTVDRNVVHNHALHRREVGGGGFGLVLISVDKCSESRTAPQNRGLRRLMSHRKGPFHPLRIEAIPCDSETVREHLDSFVRAFIRSEDRSRAE